MPNWCYNQMVVYGSPTEIKDFHDKLSKAKEKGDKLNTWHLYQIYEEFGYKKEEILESDSNGYIRGYFDSIDDIEVESKDVWFFRLEYESAWSSMYEGFDWLLSRHYKTLKQVTLAEEMGLEVYINTDTKGKFFPEKYYMYVEDYDTFICESDRELVEEFNKFIDEPKNKVNNAKDCFSYLEKHKNVIEGKYNTWLYEYCPN